MARHSLNRTRHNGIVTKQAGAGAAGWRSPTRPRSPSSPTPTPPPGWTRPDASSPWRGSWERRGTIRCPMEGLPSRRRGGEQARLSTVVENLSILDTRRCARLGHRSSHVDLDGPVRKGFAPFPSCRSRLSFEVRRGPRSTRELPPLGRRCGPLAPPSRRLLSTSASTITRPRTPCGGSRSSEAAAMLDRGRHRRRTRPAPQR